ncbi:hypothetical protein CW670_10910 [Macrococcoides caseolyticum]|uniref:hypothetical protein n=1 Tax=Macrococcoides caseolyticum TaxID=69966 RepID=UPI000C32EF5E|nr:hypothetical protein [Macrococcus caseolyticus]PKE73641.1 hypothetical protein CW670_10910 [Macrococcus caseolyticus]
MARKISNSKLKKFTSIDERIEQLKKEKEEKQKELALSIGSYFLESFDINSFEDVDEIYEILDQAVELSDSNVKKIEKYKEKDEEEKIESDFVRDDLNDR